MVNPYIIKPSFMLFFHFYKAYKDIFFITTLSTCFYRDIYTAYLIIIYECYGVDQA